MNRNWVAFFSQSGTEIAELCKKLQTQPACIITNKQDLSGINEDLKVIINNGCIIKQIPAKPVTQDYINAIDGIDNPLITLHGYLRIIPKDICKAYEIYNLHPGLITESPELKGFDPQKRAYEAKHDIFGCVIHEVAEGVDEGKIILHGAIRPSGIESVDELILELRRVASILWMHFFKPYVN